MQGSVGGVCNSSGFIQSVGEEIVVVMRLKRSESYAQARHHHSYRLVGNVDMMWQEEKRESNDSGRKKTS
jgi:hypothetical protein